jgi:hypothetical protein
MLDLMKIGGNVGAFAGLDQPAVGVLFGGCDRDPCRDEPAMARVAGVVNLQDKGDG